MSVISLEGRALRLRLQGEIRRLRELRQRAPSPERTAAIFRLCGDINRQYKRLAELEPNNPIPKLGRQVIYATGRATLVVV